MTNEVNFDPPILCRLKPEDQWTIKDNLYSIRTQHDEIVALVGKAIPIYRWCNKSTAGSALGHFVYGKHPNSGAGFVLYEDWLEDMPKTTEPAPTEPRARQFYIIDQVDEIARIAREKGLKL